MSRQDERERVRRRLGELTARVGVSMTAGAGTATAGPEPEHGPAGWAARSPRVGSVGATGQPDRPSCTAHAVALPPAGEPGPETISGAAGKWDHMRLSGHSAPDRDAEDDVGRVRSPGWLEESVPGGNRLHRLVPERFRGVRLDPGRRGVRTLAFVGLAAMVVAGVVVFRERPIAHTVPPLPIGQSVALPITSAAATTSAAGAHSRRVDPGAPSTELVVSVVGLVQRTGLVRLPEGSRVADALAAAGGPSEGADTTGLNLAQRLSDGDQVLVGPVVPNPGAPQQGSGTIGAGGRPSSGSAAAPSRPAGAAGRIDLNTASEAELDALPGVGPVTARAIVSWRTTNGRFTSVEQLGEVDGIGPARLARLRDLVRV
ncbi:helix-hairpin-helix domain-containing protein [Nocardia sp. R7R-8]|uniref:helix-hairpin-helix domain-containing protein n=1 Tax=Nocardia sp. R7R-8 TaxID=3459304 RepID=UPI00403D6680